MNKFFLFMEERFTKDELQDIISQMELRDDCSIEDMLDFAYHHITGTPENIMDEYDENLDFWFDHLIEYLDAEDYEFCVEIKKAIQLEKNQLLRVIYYYRYDLMDEPDFMEEIKTLDTNKFKQI